MVNLKALLEQDENYLRSMVQSIVQATLEAEMTEAIRYLNMEHYKEHKKEALRQAA